MMMLLMFFLRCGVSFCFLIPHSFSIAFLGLGDFLQTIFPPMNASSGEVGSQVSKRWRLIFWLCRPPAYHM
jgi:hypothetical protein